MYKLALDKERNSTKFNGFYRGIVVDNKDPLESGRIKIRVYPMFENVEDTALPWAILADPQFGGTSNVGGINVPVIGSHVFCFFENADHRFPVYFASAPAIENDVPDVPKLSREDDGTVSDIDSNRSTGVSTAFGGTWDEPESAYSPEYPNNRVYRSSNGIVIEIDDTDGNTRLHFYHPSGTRNETDHSGNMVEHIVAKKTTVIVGDNNIEVKANQNTTVGENHGVKIGTDGKVDVGNDYTIVTGNDCTFEVGNDCTFNVGNACNITTGADCTLTASGDTVVTSSGSITLTGATININ